MNFTFTHKRAVMGNDITVSVTSDASRPITKLVIVLDGSKLSEETPTKPATSMTRDFLRVGEAAPGKNHTLSAEAFTGDNKSEFGTAGWTDAV